MVSTTMTRLQEWYHVSWAHLKKRVFRVMKKKEKELFNTHEIAKSELLVRLRRWTHVSIWKWAPREQYLLYGEFVERALTKVAREKKRAKPCLPHADDYRGRGRQRNPRSSPAARGRDQGNFLREKCDGHTLVSLHGEGRYRYLIFGFNYTLCRLRFHLKNQNLLYIFLSFKNWIYW